jgi:hypothetical protein
MPDYLALKAELEKPDLASLGDVAAASKLNADQVTTTEPRTIVPSYEVWEAIVPAEWKALTADEKQRIQTIVGMGQVNLAGPNTRSALATAFGVGTASRTSLLALQTLTVSISRAVSIPGWGISVSAGDVAHARSL